MGPKTRLDKPDGDLLMSFAFDAEPNITFWWYLIDELKQRTWFEQFVADLILDEGQEVKEVSVVDLGVAQNIPEGIGEGGFNFEQGLQTDFVDLFEGVPIDIREVLYL